MSEIERLRIKAEAFDEAACDLEEFANEYRYSYVAEKAASMLRDRAASMRTQIRIREIKEKASAG